MSFNRVLPLFVVAVCFSGHGFAAEGRIPIYQVGTVITEPGRYVVTQNLSGAGATPIIDIVSHGVDVDLNGFVLHNATGPAPVIRANPWSRVAIRNGTVVGGGVGLQLGNYQAVVENVTVYQPTGYGISITSGTHHIIRNVTVDNPGSDAIFLNDTSTLVDDVRIRFAGGHGIHVIADQGNGTTVRNCSMSIVALNGIYFEGAGAAGVVNNLVGASGEGIRIDAVGLGARVWDNRVNSISHAIHLSGGSGGSIMRNSVRSTSGHGIYVAAPHTVVEGNQADGCYGFGLYLAVGSNFSTYGRNAMQENQGVLATCSAGPPNVEFCNEGGGNASFGDNLMPGVQ